MDSKSLFERAIQYIESKNFARAVDYFKVILSKDKNNDDVWVLIGLCQTNLKEFSSTHYMVVYKILCMY